MQSNRSGGTEGVRDKAKQIAMKKGYRYKDGDQTIEVLKVRRPILLIGTGTVKYRRDSIISEMPTDRFMAWVSGKERCDE